MSIRCENCNQLLTGQRVFWLELDTLSGVYYAPAAFPRDGLSQGLFAFGEICAARALGLDEDSIEKKNLTPAK